MSDPTFMSVGDLAARLAKITGNSETYHGRQLRAQTREGALVPSMRGGSGKTAPALFDHTGLCRALVLHVLASRYNQEMPVLKDVPAIMATVDPRARKGDTLEPSDGMELAIARVRAGQKMYLHVEFGDWPDPGQEDRAVSGWITESPEVAESPVAETLGWIVLPLHTILKPLLA